MTGHPDELLAAYVDGDLDGADQRAVETHVRSCERCRREVEMATRARRALATVPDVEPPAGTAFRVLREARRAPATGRAWRFATAAGIAASLIAGAVVVVQRVDLGGGAAQMTADSGREAAPAADGPEALEGASEEAAGAAREAALVFRASDEMYEFEDMPEVVARLERRAAQLRLSDRALTTDTSAADPAAGPAGAALECVRSAIPEDAPGVPFSIERASFLDEGRYVPGYVTAFLRARSDDRLLRVWVVNRETCAGFLYSADVVL